MTDRSGHDAADGAANGATDPATDVATDGGTDPEDVDIGQDATYRTVTDPGEAAFTVDGSEFIGVVASVETVDAAEAVVEERREAYPDATHTVPAYRVRADPLREYSSDDGEPSGSAGKPMLSVLSGEDLENVVAVVTRYYGGTNLGVGGLVRAYSRAVTEALAATEILTERPHERLAIEVAYDDSGTVRGIVESSGVDFSADYEETVRFEVRVPVVESAELRDRIASATSGRAIVSEEGDEG